MSTARIIGNLRYGETLTLLPTFTGDDTEIISVTWSLFRTADSLASIGDLAYSGVGTTTRVVESPVGLGNINRKTDVIGSWLKVTVEFDDSGEQDLDRVGPIYDRGGSFRIMRDSRRTPKLTSYERARRGE